jgi:hypothetical protein
MHVDRLSWTGAGGNVSDKAQQSAVASAGGADEVVLSQRALNRATLARQMLLERTSMSALEALEHLVGMQGQVPRAPYTGLWARLKGFRAEELSSLMASRQAVRAPLMRATIHMTSARDCLEVWPLTRPVLERNLFTGSPFGRNLKGMDLDALLEAGRGLIEEQPRTTAELNALLGERWPDRDGESMAYAINRLLPVVQVTPRGLWERSGQTKWAPVDVWLGEPVSAEPSLETLVLRYLAAFGPASVNDIQNWSGLTRMRETFEALRPRLLVFRGEAGKELFDLPDAPRPDSQTPAPVRFLPVYDNLLLGHADRSRFFAADTIIPPSAGSGRDIGAILVDGFVRGIWKINVEKRDAVLRIETFPGLAADQLPAVEEEGRRLLEFVASRASSRELAFGSI